jgi:hypothetical protein
MDYIEGTKVTEVSPLALQDLEAKPLIEQLFKAYLKQVLVDGVFHADPHPGNVFVTPDGRIALIDLGMVGHTSQAMQESLLKILLAVSQGNGDDTADQIIRISERTEEFDPAEFRRRITRLVTAKHDQGLEQMNVGRSLFDLSSKARDTGLFVPSELTLLGKTLLQLDEVGSHPRPDVQSERGHPASGDGAAFAPREEGPDARQSLHLLARGQGLCPSAPAAGQPHPRRRDQLRARGKVKAVDAKVMLDGMQKIANRITAGLVLAALIIGAALLMRVQTRFELFGYPGLAILCFIAAAAGAFWLVINIFVQDYRSRKRVPR